MVGKNKNKKNRKKMNANMKKIVMKKRNSAANMSKKNILDQNKLQKEEKINNNRGVGKCARQSGPDDDHCMDNIGNVMLYVGNQVTNFMKQKKRTESFVKLMERKGGKNYNFVNTTGYLESACSKSPRYDAFRPILSHNLGMFKGLNLF